MKENSVGLKIKELPHNSRDSPLKITTFERKKREVFGGKECGNAIP